MTNNNLLDFLQQGLRTAIGATVDMVETIKDDQKRNQALSDFTYDWQQKSQEWAKKGTMTEEEAKKIIEQFFQGYHSQSRSYQEIEITSDDTSQESIEDLTKEIIALREELQRLNNSSSS